MYKVGDKLLCIESSDYLISNNVKVNNTYTVIEIVTKGDSIYYRIDDGSCPFGVNSRFSKKFASLKEHRKQKLKIICSKQEIE